MFLILILFGVLALGLAFVTYWQVDVQASRKPPVNVPVAAAKATAAPKTDVAPVPADAQDSE